MRLLQGEARAASAGWGKSGRQASRRSEEANTWSCTELFPSPCARQEQRSSMSLFGCQGHEFPDRVFYFIAQLLLFLGSFRVGNRAAFSDSRSNFHTRVGYRTNVCRRRLASDLARASERNSCPRSSRGSP